MLRRTIDSAQVPTASQVAVDPPPWEAAVLETFHTLAESHVYVLEPGDPSLFRMVNPFSAVPTHFAVTAGGQRYFRNCVWNSLGIGSLLGVDGIVETTCPDYDERLSLTVAGRRLLEAEGIVHFGVPARHWWDDIVFT